VFLTRGPRHRIARVVRVGPKLVPALTTSASAGAISGDVRVDSTRSRSVRKQLLMAWLRIDGVVSTGAKQRRHDGGWLLVFAHFRSGFKQLLMAWLWRGSWSAHEREDVFDGAWVLALDRAQFFH
jgi:hypothetical protein